MNICKHNEREESLPTKRLNPADRHWSQGKHLTKERKKTIKTTLTFRG
jgi:hypothetical protein